MENGMGAKPYSEAANDWHYAAASGGIADTNDVVLKAASAAGLRNYLTALQITNKDATIGTEVVVKDGSTVIWRMFIQPGTPASLSGLVPASFTFPTPLKSSANTALNAACITNSSETYINAQGYVAP
jgi:hypothetical protein